MKKTYLVFILLFVFLNDLNADYLSEYRNWLIVNKQNQFLDKDGNVSKELISINKKNQLGERFKWKSNPSLERLHYQVFHFKQQHKNWDKHVIMHNNNPYKFKINLSKDKGDLIKSIDKEMQKTGLLSYLLFENDEIVIDKISPKNRLGTLYNSETKWTTASVGKSYTSYLLGHAICDGYIKNVDVRLNDWPLLKNTLYENVKLIDLLNMAAGDQKLVKNNDLAKGKGIEKNPNVNTLKYHMEGYFKGSKPSKNQYNYSNLVANIILNYIWFKSEGNFQKLTNKVFKEKAKIKDQVYFLKIDRSKTQGRDNGVRYRYEVKDEDGPLRYSMEATRYDHLRIAKAMMDDWKNDTCEGKYLKTIYERRIAKLRKKYDKTNAYTFGKSYGGQFHFDFGGFKDRKIFVLDGAYGQSILIDMDNFKIVAINGIHMNYNWHKIALSALK